jgi:nitrate reductase delta subunit
VYQVAAWCLGYPDDALLARLPLLRDALREQGGGAVTVGAEQTLAYLESHPLEELQRHYVEVFDLDRRHALYLSYWTDGDTRRRGEVLARFKAVYRASGYLVDTHGELPDYLPLVLEFAAVVDLDAGTALLQEYRASTELLRLELEASGTDYAGLLASVCATLPGASPATRVEAMALAGAVGRPGDTSSGSALSPAGPPVELVGLEPFDPRLLPVRSVS